MEFLLDLLKILLPASLVMYGMYIIVQSFVKKELGQIEKNTEAQLQLRQAELSLKRAEVELKNKEQSLNIRLQAYERMTLFLERISPSQLIPRLNNPDYSAGFFQQVLIQEIRNEFGHNLSQQIYLSSEAWLLIKQALEESILLINNSVMALEPNAEGVDLAKKILNNVREHSINPTENAIEFLKEEVRGLF